VAIQQQIPQGPSPNRGHHGDDGNAEPIQTLATSGEHSADGEDGDAEQVKYVTD
jgi:hypothetical protein